ncbi:hypothetical protein Sliba_80090 [Streptomyces nigrescens]|nr:hypothetical protein Sliba_80090 [Streptomyces libani subsp. libani]
MTDAFLERYARGNAYNKRQVRKVIADTLTNGTDSSELWQALERLGSLSKPVSAGTLQFAFSELRQTQNPSNVIAQQAGNSVPVQLGAAIVRAAVGEPVAPALEVAA